MSGADPADTAAGPADQRPVATEIAAATLLQPRVRTGDPAFAPMYAAVRDRRAVTFDYRKEPARPAETRNVQPWGLVSFRGRWYVIGHDETRGERRTFRLSRIAGPVKTVGRAGAVSTPEGIDLLAEVAATRRAPGRPHRDGADPRRPGASGCAARRVSAEPSPNGPDWDRVTIPLGHLWDTARRIAAHGPDVVVEEPPDLVDATVRLLRATLKQLAAGTPVSRTGTVADQPALDGTGPNPDGLNQTGTKTTGPQVPRQHATGPESGENLAGRNAQAGRPDE